MTIDEAVRAKLIETLQDLIKAVESGSVAGVVIARVSVVGETHIMGDVAGVAVHPAMVRFALDRIDEWAKSNESIIPPSVPFAKVPMPVQ